MIVSRSRALRAVVALSAVVCLARPSAAQPAAWTGAVFTANEKAQSVSIVDAGTWTVRQTLHFPAAPHNVQTSQDGRYLYVTGNTPMEMKNMPPMSDMMMEMMEPGYLFAYDLHNLQAGPLLDIHLGMHAAHVVADRANRFAYVTVSGENAVKVVDVRDKTVAAIIPVGRMPHGLRMSPDQSRIYVSDMDDNAISFIDVSQRKEIARVPVGMTPVQVAVAPDGKTVYVTLAGNNAVGIVDVAAQKLVATVHVGPNPAQLYISPDGLRVYVANQGTKDSPGHTVSVIDTVSRTVVATVEVPGGAHGVVVTPDGSRVFVTNAFDSKLTEIDARTLSVRTIDVGEGPNGVTLGR